MRFDYEWNWFWWSIGCRFRHPPYGTAELMVGLGPLLLIFDWGERG